MNRFWRVSEQKFPDDLILLTLPQRLSDAETVRLLGETFEIMVAVLIEDAAIADVALSYGYTCALAEQQTPALRLESFVHEREEHRLILNSHAYQKFSRRVLNLTIPGGMTLEALERFRMARDCVGATYKWHDHIYGEWRTADRPLLKQRSGRSSPVFIELRQDFFQGEPLVMRVMFHQVVGDA